MNLRGLLQRLHKLGAAFPIGSLGSLFGDYRLTRVILDLATGLLSHQEKDYSRLKYIYKSHFDPPNDRKVAYKRELPKYLDVFGLYLSLINYWKL
jgi:hypothetical protein